MNHSRNLNSEAEISATYAECLLRVIGGVWFGASLVPLFLLVPVRMLEFFESSGLHLSDYVLLVFMFALFSYFTWVVFRATWTLYKERGLTNKSPQRPSMRAFRRAQIKGWLIFTALLTWVLLVSLNVSYVDTAFEATPWESFAFRSFLLYSPIMVTAMLRLCELVRCSHKNTPCQRPRSHLPLCIGIDNELWVNIVLI